MKILLNKILILFTAAIFLVACDKEEFTVLNPDATTTVSISTTDVVLEKNNAGQDVLTVTWTEPDYGFNAGAQYQVILSTANGSKAVSVGSQLSKTFENVELNKILLGLGLEGGIASTVSIQVKAILSDYKDLTSNVSDFTATVYVDKLDLSTEWGIVGSAYNNWGETPDAPFYTTSDPNVIVAYVTLKTGEFKVRTNNEWGNDYGDANLDGVFDQDSDNNISVVAGTYKITFNTSTFAYTIEEYSWGIVGSAYNNWGETPDAMLEYDPYTDQWRVIVTLLEGQMKIRSNNVWGNDYGDATLDGILDKDADNNINVEAGNYLVTVDFNTLEYSIEPIDIWGIVGSGYNNWGETPDAAFKRDWEFDDVWVINNVTLLDGEIKFRTNNAWGNDYGDANLDGILDKDDGNNIAVTAGDYKVVLDFRDANAPTYTLTQL
jgi:hypothetical protein